MISEEQQDQAALYALGLLGADEDAAFESELRANAELRDLVRELRSSETAVMEALSRMNRAGLVAQNSDGRFAFAPVSARHEQLAAEIEKAYNSTPMSVVKAIIALPEEKLRAFSAAFKLKE